MRCVILNLPADLPLSADALLSACPPQHLIGAAAYSSLTVLSLPADCVKSAFILFVSFRHFAHISILNWSFFFYKIILLDTFGNFQKIHPLGGENWLIYNDGKCYIIRLLSKKNPYVSLQCLSRYHLWTGVVFMDLLHIKLETSLLLLLTRELIVRGTKTDAIFTAVVSKHRNSRWFVTVWIKRLTWQI